MPVRIALHHVTTYRYDRAVGLSPHAIRLRPAPHCRTRILSYALTVVPSGHFLHWQQDPLGNHVARVVFPERVAELRVGVDLLAEIAAINPFDFFVEPDAEKFPFRYTPRESRELSPFLELEERTPLFGALVDELSARRAGTVEFLVELARRVRAEVAYLVRHEPGVQTKEETLEKAVGSCRDSAWLAVQLLRHLGTAARFVSGYLVQLAPEGGPEVDFADLHAWCEVYVPGAGWIGLDTTSGMLASEGHIPLACSTDPEGAAPITGNLEACEVVFGHTLTMRRLATPAAGDQQ